MVKEPTKELIRYVEEEIIPKYHNFDRAHNVGHVQAVIAESLHLAAYYDVNTDIVYTTAAYHDLGLQFGRETHHIESARIVRSDAVLRGWFSHEEIELIAEAVEDHRASNKHEPRSIYGRIVAEADRQIIPDDIIRRAVEYGLDKYPELKKEEQWRRMRSHMLEKYAEGGYMRLYIPESHNAHGLAALREIISDEYRLRALFEKFYAPPSPYLVRKAAADDMNDIIDMLADSRELMRINGNKTQWVNGYPSQEVILNDIASGNGYIIYGRNSLAPVGYFAFIIGDEPTYNIIVGGSWADPDQPYGTIHRLARKHGYNGIAAQCLDFCKSQICRLRADTHKDNVIVQNILEHEGFQYRGIIHVSDGTERIAYQWKATD